MRKSSLPLLFVLALSFLAIIPCPVFAVATYSYNGTDAVTIRGSTANFMGWYSADVAGGWNTIHFAYGNQFWLNVTNLKYVYVGDGENTTLFWDTLKQVHFANVHWTVKNNATLRFGQLSGQKASSGVQVISNLLLTGLTGSTIELYDVSMFFGKVISAGSSRVYGCHFYLTTLTLKDTDVYEVLIHNTYFDGLSGEMSGNVDRVEHHGLALAQATNTYNLSISNVNTKPSLYIFGTFAGLTWSGTCNLTNVNSTNWLIDWVGVSDTGVVWRKYTFDLNVTFQNVALANATVTLVYHGQGGGTVGSWLTYSNGSIPQQTLVMGFYNSTGNDALYSFNPYLLTVELSKFETQTLLFNIQEKTDLTLELVREPKAKGGGGTTSVEVPDILWYLGKFGQFLLDNWLWVIIALIIVCLALAFRSEQKKERRRKLGLG